MSRLIKVLAAICAVVLLVYFLDIYACTHIQDQPKKEDFALEQIRDI